MIRKAIPLVVIAAIVLGAAGFAFADGWRPGPRVCAPGTDVQEQAQLIRSLGLTAEQVEQIQAALSQSYAFRYERQQQLSELMHQFRQALWQRDPDADTLAVLRQKMNELREQMRGEDPQQWRHRVGSVLTEEQQALLEEAGCGTSLRSRAMGRVRAMRDRLRPAVNPANGGGSTR